MESKIEEILKSGDLVKYEPSQELHRSPVELNTDQVNNFNSRLINSEGNSVDDKTVTETLQSSPAFSSYEPESYVISCKKTYWGEVKEKCTKIKVKKVKGDDKKESPKTAPANQLVNANGNGVTTGNNDMEEKTEQEILELIIKSCEPFLDQFGKVYVRFEVNGGYETKPVSNSIFQNWLYHRYQQLTDELPSDGSISKLIQGVEAKVIFDNEKQKLDLRVTSYEGRIYYDLADNQAVMVEPNNWAVIQAPVHFERNANTLPQVVPKPSENGLRMLLDYFNLKEDADKRLLQVKVVTALIPWIAHPILIFWGDKGAGKTFGSRILKVLIDPARMEVAELNRNKRQFDQILEKNYFIVLDNLDHLINDLSNTLCQTVTGRSTIKGKSGDTEVIIFYRRNVIMNGINLMATKPDLLDRSLLFKVKRIQTNMRREEEELWRDFLTVRPLILGSMFDALAKAMAIYPSVSIPNLPRMADFCKWGYAVAEAIGIGGKQFLEDYNRNLQLVNKNAIKENPLAFAIVRFMDDKEEYTRTMKAFLDELTTHANTLGINTKAGNWPKGANVLSRYLNEVKSNLEEAGIVVTKEPSTATETKNHTIIKLKKDEQLQFSLS